MAARSSSALVGHHAANYTRSRPASATPSSERTSLIGESVRSGKVFDRWVIDAEGMGASNRMQNVMAETMVPYTVESQPIKRLGRSPCVVRRAQFDGLSLLDCDVPDVFSGCTHVTDGASSDVLLFSLTTAGQQVVEQDHRQAVLEPGDIFIVDSARPGTCHIPSRIHSYTLVVPKDLVSIRAPLSEKLPASSPIARLLGDYLRLLVRELATLPAAAVSVAARATLELVQLATTSDSPAPDALPLRVALLPQVRRYIERQLADPDLSPSAIANANAISVRTLHAMFAATGESVSGYIRRRRLEGSRDELIDRQDRAVIDISRNWGFKNASHFARAFKAEYKIAPHELRRTLIAAKQEQTPPA
jgi:AraC-like DNA-binding protein